MNGSDHLALHHQLLLDNFTSFTSNTKIQSKRVEWHLTVATIFINILSGPTQSGLQSLSLWYLVWFHTAL